MRSRHHRQRSDEKPLEIVLPITPMLDMSFQLLAFFVMTFESGNALEGQLDMFLPKQGEARAKDQDKVDLNKSSEDIDTASDITVSLSSSNGNIDGIKILEKATTTTVADLKQLGAALKKMHDEGTGEKDNIKIEADSKLKFAKLIDVMDACLAAGYRQVGFAAPPDLGRK